MGFLTALVDYFLDNPFIIYRKGHISYEKIHLLFMVVNRGLLD